MTVISELLGAEPTVVVSPRSPDELADAIRDAVAAGHAVVPQGGGTGQDYGYPLRPGAYTLVETSGMDRIVAVEPGDLTITVESGVTLAAVQDALRPHGLFLPLDPPHSDRATVGGILATNAFGASRLGYGTARDWLIGLSVVNADGRIVKGGGKVVKNVTGYDTPKMHIGALGTLGVLAEATFKVAPLPEATHTVVASIRDGATPGAAMARILAETQPAKAYRRTDAHGDFVVCVYAGFIEVAMQAAEFARDALRPCGSVAVYPEAMGEAEDVPVLSLRLSGPMAGDGERHESVLPNAVLTPELGTVVKTFYGVGITEIAWQEPAFAAATQTTTYALHTTGQTFTHAPLALRRHETFRVWSPEPASLPLMRRIKTALDPGDIFNPGRFVVR